MPRESIVDFVLGNVVDMLFVACVKYCASGIRTSYCNSGMVRRYAVAVLWESCGYNPKDSTCCLGQLDGMCNLSEPLIQRLDGAANFCSLITGCRNPRELIRVAEWVDMSPVALPRAWLLQGRRSNENIATSAFERFGRWHDDRAPRRG